MTLFYPEGTTVIEQSDQAALRTALATLRTAPLQLGLEREAWRIDGHGCPSTAPHPFAPDREQFAEGRITVDFAENQAELITAPEAGSAAALAQLRRLHGRLYRAVPGELLWPLSTPGCWNGEVQPASFGGAAAQEGARQYRDYLAGKYGAARQAISGVHFNVSFPEAFWAALETAGDEAVDRSARYFAVMRNLLRYRFVLTYLLGASPLVDVRWGAELAERLDAPGRALFSACGRHSSSLRSGPLGYQLSERTAAELGGVWSGLSEFVGGIRGALATGTLAGEREFYASVRPKTGEGGSLDALQRRGVEYLEIRVLDLDPFAPSGVALPTLRFLEAFAAAAALLPDRPLTAADLAEEAQLNTWATMCSCPDSEGVRTALATAAEPLWPALREAAELLGPGQVAAVAEFAEIFAGRKPRLVDRFFAGAAASGLSLRDFGLRLAHQHRERLEVAQSLDSLSEGGRPFSTVDSSTATDRVGVNAVHLRQPVPGDEIPMIELDPLYDGMELSTRLLIAEALHRGATVEVLDRSDNFVRLVQSSNVQLVKQATRTSADTYISALAMENKQVTKAELERAGLRVPAGRLHDSVTDALADWPRVQGRATVVKPRSTNFGEGVAILGEMATEAEFATAVRAAFALDAAVLVEEFVSGREFRFLVIGGRTRAVLHRVPANVVGDGQRTIRELVTEKNRHPFRGEGYLKPLEKIVLGEVEVAFLAAAGLSPDSVPEAGRTVFLRKNSNISTGGDSIDWTDTMPAVYHRIAERATAALGAQISGVDMIVPDPTAGGAQADYSIIELNFNPALHIHDYPETGTNRRVEGHVLDLIGITLHSGDDRRWEPADPGTPGKKHFVVLER